ncbi:cytochrome P450 2J2-like [Clavelina lepadiformis]|uniref:cytochrome P450 2J2-like n=1 Tax=Clavelina lepadiformis TaxID=159417 RepID=UPI004042D1E2
MSCCCGDPEGFPPGRKGVPFLGCAPFVGSDAPRAFFNWSKDYGSIMSVRMGKKTWVVLNDYDSMYQAFIEQQSKASSRPLIPLLDQYNEGLGLGSVRYGEFFKANRSFGEKILRGAGIGAQTIEERVIEESGFLVDAIKAKSGKSFTTRFPLNNASCNVLWSILFGERADYDDASFNRLISALCKTINEDPGFPSTAISLMGLTPSLMNFPLFKGVNEEYLQNFKNLLKVFADIIDKHKETYSEKFSRGFVDAYVKKVKKGTPHFSYEQLVQFARELFNAGAQPTAGMVGWGLLCLIHYPETQKKLRAEINKVIGKGKVTTSSQASMPYTNAFIQELMRFRTMVIFTVPHETTEDMDLKGFKIPKGTTVLGNVWGVNNHPDYWEHAEKFDPERFIDENGDFIKSDHVVSYGIGGPRDCIGYHVAQLEIFIMLVSMVRKFEFLPDPDASDLPPIDKGAIGAFFIPALHKLVAKEI